MGPWEEKLFLKINRSFPEEAAAASSGQVEK
jgi:hypothetical protein